LGLQGSVVRLRLEPGKEGLHTAQMEERMQQALQRRFGAATGLSIEHGVAGAEAPSDTLAQREARAAAQALAAARAALDADPKVMELGERFGARVAADTIQPNS